MGFVTHINPHTSLSHDGEASQVVTSPASVVEPPTPPGRFRRFWLCWTSPYVTSSTQTEYEICERP